MKNFKPKNRININNGQSNSCKASEAREKKEEAEQKAGSPDEFRKTLFCVKSSGLDEKIIN